MRVVNPSRRRATLRSETISTDPTRPSIFPFRPAQVYYHLGEMNDALNYALCAGSLFDVTETTDFVQTLLAKAIDAYIEQRSDAKTDDVDETDKRLVAIVERMFERC